MNVIEGRLRETGWIYYAKAKAKAQGSREAALR